MINNSDHRYGGGYEDRGQIHLYDQDGMAVQSASMKSITGRSVKTLGIFDSFVHWIQKKMGSVVDVNINNEIFALNKDEAVKFLQANGKKITVINQNSIAQELRDLISRTHLSTTAANLLQQAQVVVEAPPALTLSEDVSPLPPENSPSTPRATVTPPLSPEAPLLSLIKAANYQEYQQRPLRATLHNFILISSQLHGQQSPSLCRIRFLGDELLPAVEALFTVAKTLLLDAQGMHKTNTDELLPKEIFNTVANVKTCLPQLPAEEIRGLIYMIGHNECLPNDDEDPAIRTGLIQSLETLLTNQSASET